MLGNSHKLFLSFFFSSDCNIAVVIFPHFINNGKLQAAVHLVDGTGVIPLLFCLSSFATMDSSVTTAGLLVGVIGSVQPSPTWLLRMEVL